MKIEITRHAISRCRARIPLPEGRPADALIRESVARADRTVERDDGLLILHTSAPLRLRAKAEPIRGGVRVVTILHGNKRTRGEQQARRRKKWARELFAT